MDLAVSIPARPAQAGQARQERLWRWTMGGLLALGLSTHTLAASDTTAQKGHSVQTNSSAGAVQPLADAQSFAQLAEQMPAIRAQVAQLLEQTRRSPTAMTDELQRLANDQQRPPLQRDALIHSYAMALRQLRPDQVDAASLQWLALYPAQSWVRHDESASYLLPAFDVPAALAGTRNEWDFQAGVSAANSVREEQIAQRLHQYLRASAAFRHGYDQQIQLLDDTRLESWQNAIKRVPEMSHSALAGEVLLRHGSVVEIAGWLQHASPTQELSLLRRARQRYPEESGTAFFYQLCQQLQQQGSRLGQCLGLAPLPLRSDDPMNQAWQDFLAPLLSDAELGASAAQILARQIADGRISMAQLEHWRETLRDERAQQRIELMAHLIESHEQSTAATENAQ